MASSIQDPRQNGHVTRVGTSDIIETSAFLRRSFEAEPSVQFASPEVLRWKYLEPGALGLDEAAFLLGSNGRIAAHAGLRTSTIRGINGAKLTCGTLIDWAADRAAPGAGIALYRHLLGQAAATYLLGGTHTTRAVAERLGFKRAMRARIYSRWVRPFNEFMRRPKTARSALRLLHGVAHAPLDALAPIDGWSAKPVPSFDASFGELLMHSSQEYASPERTVALLNHRLRNPLTTTSGYVLYRDGKAVGCALTAMGEWNARILLLQGRFDTAALAPAYALLTAELARNPEVCRVSALCSAPSHQGALEQNAYWINRVEPVSFYDPSGRVPALGPISIQYLDADLDDYNS
jgi:hypothetical protein